MVLQSRHLALALVVAQALAQAVAVAAQALVSPDWHTDRLAYNPWVATESPDYAHKYQAMA